MLEITYIEDGTITGARYRLPRVCGKPKPPFVDIPIGQTLSEEVKEDLGIEYMPASIRDWPWKSDYVKA